MSIAVLSTPAEIAATLGEVRLLQAEFMYAPRPALEPQRRVFDYCLSARLRALQPGDAVVLIADSAATVVSLEPFAAAFPHLRFAAIVCNAATYPGEPGDTPARCGWVKPQQWRRAAMTDRWARLLCALELGAALYAQQGAGALLLPAWDAVYHGALLDDLVQRSAQHGGTAAISPLTFYQHSPVAGVSYAAHVIDALNAACWRDSRLLSAAGLEDFQGLWGKMSLLPFRWCAPLRAQVEPQLWEDDREISSVLAALGGTALNWLVRDPRRYRLSPLLFTPADLKRALLRILHYSLDIPAPTVGGASALTQRPDARIQAWIASDSRWQAAYGLAERLIEECTAETGARLAQFGCSWVDWGRFRCVARVGEAQVEVWQRSEP